MADFLMSDIAASGVFVSSLVTCVKKMCDLDLRKPFRKDLITLKYQFSLSLNH